MTSHGGGIGAKQTRGQIAALSRRGNLSQDTQPLHLLTGCQSMRHRTQLTSLGPSPLRCPPGPENVQEDDQVYVRKIAEYAMNDGVCVHDLFQQKKAVEAPAILLKPS